MKGQSFFISVGVGMYWSSTQHHTKCNFEKYINIQATPTSFPHNFHYLVLASSLSNPVQADLLVGTLQLKEIVASLSTGKEMRWKSTFTSISRQTMVLTWRRSKRSIISISVKWELLLKTPSTEWNNGTSAKECSDISKGNHHHQVDFNSILDVVVELTNTHNDKNPLRKRTWMAAEWREIFGKKWL